MGWGNTKQISNNRVVKEMGNIDSGETPLISTGYSLLRRCRRAAKQNTADGRFWRFVSVRGKWKRHFIRNSYWLNQTSKLLHQVS